jgi:hypothetical protein
MRQGAGKPLLTYRRSWVPVVMQPLLPAIILPHQEDQLKFMKNRLRCLNCSFQAGLWKRTMIYVE